MSLNPNITIFPERPVNTKASERYVPVKFYYPQDGEKWLGWVPIEYRRTGINIPDNDIDALNTYLNDVYEQLNPSNYDEWKREQDSFWEATRSVETKDIFYILCDGKWHCRNCEISNPNFARRIQDLKEMGYTISTHINYECPVCNNRRSTNLILLPIKRVELSGNGYETWSSALRARIIDVLDGVDVYENRKNQFCLPDHKFSEIRWDDDTREENPNSMSEETIKEKFQLLSNQRNQQKREVCRYCYQTGHRGTIFGIPFFYEGGPMWDESIPKKGKSAEKGCVGCPWYDIETWRKKLIARLGESNGDKREH